MARFTLRRLAGMVFVLFAISLAVFLIYNVIPNSDPAARLAGEKAAHDKHLLANIEEEWGFDESLPVQYGSMMKKVFTGDLVSYQEHTDVDEEIVNGLPATLSLCVGAAIIWMFFAILFGYLSAIKPSGIRDRLLTVLALVGVSMPVFWLAGVLLIYLTFKTEIFPASEYVGITEEPLEWAYHLILPWFTLAFLSIGFYSRVLRSNMLDTMNEDWVRTARAKGLSERQVRIRHVLRNSLIPIVTLFGLDFGAMLAGGAILTEYVYGLGGVGQYAAEAVKTQDLPPLMAVTLFGAFFIVLFNALVDIAYAKLDPRVQLGESVNG
jgi:peptide/nickel transport system permease protein